MEAPVGAKYGLKGCEHGHKTGRGPFSWALSASHRHARETTCVPNLLHA
jgi:hypothetical protein